MVIVVVPKGLRGLIKFLAVDLGLERTDAQLGKVERQVAFARRYGLIDDEQKPDLAEMLISGAKLHDAVSELRAHGIG